MAASATGGGAGSFILSFSDNSTSAPIAFNAPDWFSGASGAALTHFGAVYATGSNGQFYTDNPAGNEPSLYQTIVNLAALGLNAKPIVSLKFTMPDGAGTSVLTDTGVFALSGARLPYVVLPPSNLTVLLGGNATFTVTAGGTPPLQYQWLLNGVPLANNSQITGAQSNILNLGNIPAADAGSYQVMVANGSGIVTSKVGHPQRGPPAFLPKRQRQRPVLCLFLDGFQWVAIPTSIQFRSHFQLDKLGIGHYSDEQHYDGDQFGDEQPMLLSPPPYLPGALTRLSPRGTEPKWICFIKLT